MEKKVIMPQMGESVIQGTVAKWLAKAGEAVKIDQPIAEVETDKAVIEIPCPANGILSRILVNEGETADVGKEIAVIVEEVSGGTPEGALESPPKVSFPPATVQELFQQKWTVEKGERRRITPVVRSLAEKYKVDLSRVKGSGALGRITKEDILDYIGKSQSAHAPQTENKKEMPSGTIRETETGEVRQYRYEPKEGDQIVPFSRIRKLIAEHMTASKRISPHVTTVTEVDFTGIVKLRNEKKKDLMEKTGLDLTFLPFVVAAAVGGLKEYPLLNSSVIDEKIIIKKEINIGIAVETEEGLIVPVIHRAETLSLIDIVREIGSLVEKARQKRLTPQEISGGTFTISNPGQKGNLFGTPIIFQPQVGILRMGEIGKRPIVIRVEEEDALVIRSMMYLSLSYDHRIIDGMTANTFLHRVKEILEEGRFVF